MYLFIQQPEIGGLLAILIATFLFLPVLLVLRERRLEKKREKGKSKGEIVHKDISFKSLGAIGDFLSRRYIATIIASIIVTVLLILSAMTPTHSLMLFLMFGNQ